MSTKRDHQAEGQGAASPPTSYEELIKLIHDRYDAMSRSYQKIAVFLTQNPNDVAVLSVNLAAQKCGLHPSSFVRYAQSLGYGGYKELQSVFQRRLSTAAPGFDHRIQALQTELGTKKAGAIGFLQELVARDIASLQDLLVNLNVTDIEAATDMIEKADTIYLLGQLRSSPVAELFRYVLTMLGKRTILLDASGGLATHMAKTIRPNDLLLLISFRFYAIEVVNIAEAAAARNIPILALTDSTLSPYAKLAKVLLAVPEHEYTFSRSLAAPMCLAQALCVNLASRLQKETETPRIPIATEK